MREITKFLDAIGNIRGFVRLRSLLVFVVLCLGLAFGSVASSRILFSESVTAPDLGNPATLSYGDGDISFLKLALQSFDTDSRTINSSVILFVTTGSPAFDSGLDLLVARSWKLIASEPILFSAQRHDLQKSRAGDKPEYRAEDLRLVLDGDPTSFPFDSYEGLITISAFPPPTQGSFEAEPMTLEVSRTFGGFSVALTEMPFEDESIGTHAFQIRLTRSIYDRVVFIVAASLFLLLVLFGLAAAFTDIGSRQPLALLLGIVSVGFALPAVRSLIVPEEIDTRTLFDGYVILPYLVGSILIVFVVGARTLLANHHREH